MGEIDLLRRPEGSHLVLVHLPDVVVLDGQDDEPVGVLLEEWLWDGSLGLCEVAVLGLNIVLDSIEVVLRQLGVKELGALEVGLSLELAVVLRVSLLDSVVLLGIMRVLRENLCDFLLMIH